MRRNIPSPLFPSLALLLAVILAWSLVNPSTSDDTGEAPLSRQGIDAPAAAPDLAIPEAVGRVDYDTSNMDSGRVESEGTILILARIADEEGDWDVPPEGCEGWPVQLRLWDRESDTAEILESQVGDDGIARFALPAPAHVDWIRCTPTTPVGPQFGVDEPRKDLDPGDVYETILYMRPGYVAEGSVVDELGHPVPGMEVHAYADHLKWKPTPWQPGILTTMTDDQGRYRFESIPTGYWRFGIRPGDWQMLVPRHGSQKAGLGAIGVRGDGTIAEAGVIQVIRGTSVRLRVSGHDGQAVPGLSLDLRAIDFDCDHIDPTSTPKKKGAESEGRIRYPYAYHLVDLDEQGEATVNLPAARWKVLLHKGVAGWSRIEPRRELGSFHTSEEVIEFRLSRELRTMRGILLVDGVDPAPGRRVWLMAGWDENLRTSFGTTTDAEGRFRFPALAPEGFFAVRTVSTDTTLANQWEVPEDWPEQELILDVPSQEPLHLRILDVDGEPHGRFIGIPKLISWDSAPDGNVDPADSWWSFAKQRKYGLDSKGEMTLYDLRPGEYTLGLFYPHALGDGDPNDPDKPLVEWAEITRFKVKTGESVTEIRLSLAE